LTTPTDGLDDPDHRATGQVGREVGAELARRGAEVRALVRDLLRAGWLDGAELVAGSFEDNPATEWGKIK
jgi:uncharacterized protein YbjT (DUF2867 family)